MGAEPRQGCAPESHRGLCFGRHTFKKKKGKEQLDSYQSRGMEREEGEGELWARERDRFVPMEI